MSQATRPLRGVFVAIAALALSAGVVLGWNGPKEAASQGLETAGAASGHTLPARPDEQPGGTEEPTDAAATGAPEVTAPEQDVTTPTATDNHGALVAEAARMETPQSFVDAGLNHGAFVSCVARMNHGHEDPNADPNADPIDPATLTPEDCGYGAEAATTSTKTHGKSADAKGKSADAKAGNGKTKTGKTRNK